MKYGEPITVSAKAVFHKLLRTMKADDAMKVLPAAVKEQFELAGVVFQDKLGLYPVPPAKLTSVDCSGWKIFTIRQGRV